MMPHPLPAGPGLVLEAEERVGDARSFPLAEEAGRGRVVGRAEVDGVDAGQVEDRAQISPAGRPSRSGG